MQIIIAGVVTDGDDSSLDGVSILLMAPFAPQQYPAVVLKQLQDISDFVTFWTHCHIFPHREGAIPFPGFILHHTSTFSQYPFPNK